jgi:hypothetical protein
MSRRRSSPGGRDRTPRGRANPPGDLVPRRKPARGSQFHPGSASGRLRCARQCPRGAMPPGGGRSSRHRRHSPHRGPSFALPRRSPADGSGGILRYQRRARQYCDRPHLYFAQISRGHPKKGNCETVANAKIIAEDGAAPAVSEVTLRQAWERYRTAHLIRKGRSERTIDSYRDHVERIFMEWLDTPLRQLGIDPAQVANKHDRVTGENGPYIANGSMRTLRAIYNHARKTNKSLPSDNPVDAIDWNHEKRRDTGMGTGDLKAWFTELAALDNPIRREFHLFTLLSGCRPSALQEVQPHHVNFRRRILHIPKPKGGTKRAFDIPLSREMVLCLVRAIRFGRQMYPSAGYGMDISR